jgi:hypothetical protein
MTDNYIQLGGVVVMVMAFIELIKFLINKYSTKPAFNGTNKAILQELQTQNTNHLEHIQLGMDTGFDRMVDCQQKQTDRICSKLDILICGISEVKGRLDK